jgi:hypothetical protein
LTNRFALCNIVGQFGSLLQIGMMLGREMGQSWDNRNNPDFNRVSEGLRQSLPDGWKLPGNPMSLTTAQIQDLLDFIRTHWERCFLPIIDQQTTG